MSDPGEARREHGDRLGRESTMERRGERFSVPPGAGLSERLGAGLSERLGEVLASPRARGEEGIEIGRSRDGRPLRAFRFGSGPLRVSVIGGCHADEPVGPRLLRQLCGWLASLPTGDPALRDLAWWIVPHANPDGEARNRAWYGEGDEAYDPALYLERAVRELPGDDMEFGFPRGPSDRDARPENRAIHHWWRRAVEAPGGGPFHLHASLHGMGFAAGPWFLVEAAWRDRLAELMDRCRERVRALGYELHDVERLGEKGFLRLGPGFCTRPDSRAMRSHFLALGDEETAGRFRPSSMEAVRALGGDPLTLVSEMPLFLTPGVGEELGPPDPTARVWRRRIADWRARLAGGEAAGDGDRDPDGDRGRAADRDREEARARVREEMDAAGLRPMPVRDQMELQWGFLVAGIEAVTAPDRSSERRSSERRSALGRGAE